MRARILFLTEAGEGIGFGHISRSIALADGFESLNCDVSFTVRGTKNRVIHNRAFTEVNKEWFDEEYLVAVVPTYDITVVDSYRISDEMLDFISEKSENPVFLIDSQLKHGDQGIILFPSVYADEYTFESSNYLKILTGINYLLYTREMWYGLQFEVNEHVKRVGISLGSSKPEETGSIIQNLRQIFTGLTQICIFGDLETESGVNHKDVDIKWLGRLDKKNYVEELQNLDVLISNGGQTLNEALLIGLPVLPLITADNQSDNVTGWEKKGFVNGLDSRKKINLKELHERLKAFEDYNARKEFYESCRQTVDSMGAIRAAKEILQC
jgi:spore coat polysaccharide biosynthesis predicted glycosyltransferase SpsG